MSRPISVGVFNWTQFSPNAGFYPDDLPLEWRLSYFSNEFASACVNLAAISDNLDLLGEWVEDLPESFELSFYLQRTDQIPVIQRFLQLQACRISSLVIPQGGSNNLLQYENFEAILSTSDLPESCSIFRLDDIWTPHNCDVVNARIAIFPAFDNSRICRDWIEQWLQGGDPGSLDQHRTLWLQGAEVSYQQLSEVRIMIELMG